MVQSDYPPPQAIAKFLAGTTHHIRRIEIYEEDGITRWAKDTIPRLKDGTVSVDYDRDERRALDLTLDNSDRLLQNAPGEFWYDKIIKVFRGVLVEEPTRVPKVLVISDKVAPNAMGSAFRSVLVNAGYGDVQVNTTVVTQAEMDEYDIIVALSNATGPQLTALTAAYRAGKSVLVLDTDAVTWIAQTLTGETTTTSVPNSVAPVENLSHPVAQGWAAFTPPALGSTTVYFVSGVTGDTVEVISYIPSSTSTRILAIEDPGTGGKAVTLTALLDAAFFSNTEFAKFLVSAIGWLNPVVPVYEWETQIGEFMIDRISEPNFPHEMKITGRDYATKAMNSKFSYTTQFDAGYSLEALISAIASNAGIRKKQLPVTGIVIGTAIKYDRGITRWQAMKEIAASFNYSLYFNAQGYLVMNKFVDPTTEAPALYIETGEQGTLVRFEKTTTATRIYNFVVVTGESSDSTVDNVYAIAENTDPNSPTNIEEIGERAYHFTSSFMTTVEQCQAVADKFLAIHSLEEFELSFDTLMLPWLDVGQILGFIDPSPAAGDPSSFLLTSLNFPLSLSPMSGGARRLTIVG